MHVATVGLLRNGHWTVPPSVTIRFIGASFTPYPYRNDRGGECNAGFDGEPNAPTGVWSEFVPLSTDRHVAIRADSTPCVVSAMDAETIQRAIRPSIEEVYRTIGDRLWRAVYAYSGDKAVTDDAVAETFAQALRRDGAIRHPERWVWRACFRIAAGILQDRRRWVEYDPERLDRAADETPDGLVGELARLTDRQRACLVLHYYGGYPTADIAHILNISGAAARMSLTRGRRALRTVIERGGS